MTKNTILLPFACSLARMDAAEYFAGNPHESAIGNILRIGDEALSQIDMSGVPEEVRYSVAGHLALYAGVNPSAEVPPERLDALLSFIGVSPRFVRFIDANAKQHYPSLRNQYADGPFKMFIQPKEELQRYIESLASFAIKEDRYKHRRTITRLSPKEYEHPWDRMALNMVQKVKGFEFVAKAINKYSFDRLFYVISAGSFLRIGNKQLPNVHEMFIESCEILDFPNTLKFYVFQNGDLLTDAVCMADPIVLFSSELLDQTNYVEQMFFAGRELGHVKSEHIIYNGVRNIIKESIFDFLTSGVLGTLTFGTAKNVEKAIKSALDNWSRMSEFTADRAGLLCCQNIDIALQCLMKTSGAPPKYIQNLNVEAFKEQIRVFQGVDMGVLDKVAKVVASNYLAEHPWTITRAHELLKWHESGAYQQILDRVPVTHDDPLIDIESTKAWFSDFKSKISSFTAGKETSDGPDDDNWCLECGASYNAGAKFCSQCGKTL